MNDAKQPQLKCPKCDKGYMKFLSGKDIWHCVNMSCDCEMSVGEFAEKLGLTVRRAPAPLRETPRVVTTSCSRHNFLQPGYTCNNAPTGCGGEQFNGCQFHETGKFALLECTCETKPVAGEAAQPGKPYIAHCQKCGELLECPQCIQMPDGRVISNRDGRLAVSTPPAQPELRTANGAFTEAVRNDVLKPSFCGVDGHFAFQQNGSSCLMCQREQQLVKQAIDGLTPSVASAAPFNEALELIATADSYFSLLRHRGGIQWGSVGMMKEWQADQLIGKLRSFYETHKAAALSPAQAVPPAKGIYVASRASIPARGQMWRELRDSGVAITSSWIDEDGEGETADFSELWARIAREISESSALVLYAEEGDLPLKGALIEAGIAIGMGKRVVLCLPGVALDPRNYRPIGSWAHHPLVSRDNILSNAIALALSEPSAQAVAGEPCVHNSKVGTWDHEKQAYENTRCHDCGQPITLEEFLMICTRCEVSILKGEKYYRTKRGPHHETCSPVSVMPRLIGESAHYLTHELLGILEQDGLLKKDDVGLTTIGSLGVAINHTLHNISDMTKESKMRVVRISQQQISDVFRHQCANPKECPACLQNAGEAAAPEPVARDWGNNYKELVLASAKMIEQWDQESADNLREKLGGER